MPERDSNHVTIGHAGQANEAACVSEIATGHAEGGASKLIGEPADAHRRAVILRPGEPAIAVGGRQRPLPRTRKKTMTGGQAGRQAGRSSDETIGQD